MKRIAILGLILTSACQPLGSPDAAGHAASSGAVPSLTSAECETRGGTMKPVGRAQTMQCVVAYADAGKRCTTSSDCQGDCLVEEAPFPETGAAAVGQCQADSRPFGCHAKVENGKATPAICID